MKRSLLCAVLIPLFAMSALKDTQAQASAYDAEFNFQDTILYDDFNTYDNQWLLGVEEGSWTETFEEGKLYFQSHSELSKEDVIPVIIDTGRDFEIEAEIQFVKGNVNQAYGLQFGKSKKQEKQYDFFISANGQYTIDKYEDGFSDYVPFTASDHVNSYAPNKLTVRKVSDSSYFFLNEQLVHQMPFEPFFGNMMGIQVGAHSTILVDYFKVMYLDSSEEPLSKVLIIDYKHNAAEYSRMKGDPITLTVQLLNAGNKDVDQLKVSYLIPPHIESFESQGISELQVGESKEMVIELFPTRNFQENKIKVAFDIDGADVNNAEDISLIIYLQNPSQVSHDKALIQTYSEYRGGDPMKGLNVAKAQRALEVGKYYALIIGIDHFEGEWAPLRNAVFDAQSLQTVLEEKYQFDHIKTLYNKEATRQNIISEFEWLMETVGEKDNLLIYYSGHGYYNEQMEQGFWVPVDASSKQIHQYISNEQIRSFMAGIRSKHTLLVSDACFSGDIFRGKTLSIPYINSTKYYNKVYSLSSRKALTSGGIEPVLDGGRDGHSVFGYYLLKSLGENGNKYLDASELYNTIKIPVINNSEQTPMYSPVNSTGDEGGQFIFISK